MPSARITKADPADVKARCGGDEAKALQAIAETAMQQYQPKLRELVLRALVQEELKAAAKV